MAGILARLLDANRSRQTRWRLARTMVEAADVPVITKKCGTFSGESDGKTLALGAYLLLTDALGSMARLPGITYPLCPPVKKEWWSE